MSFQVHAGLENLRETDEYQTVQIARGDIIHGDRRSSLRCRAALEVRFQYVNGLGHQCFGNGTTVDLSRTGVRFHCDGQVPPSGSALDLRIEWPIRVQGWCPVDLLISGRLVRTDEDGLMVAVDRYEFRTAKERSFDTPEKPATTCSVTA